jgi:FAD/FMN-containing dehydrogenase
MSSPPGRCDLAVVAEEAPILVDLLREIPSLAVFTPSCSGYQAMRSIYNLDVKNVPLAILRPRTTSEITAIVFYTIKHTIPFSVRVGGHDMFGRSMPHQELVIDLRELNYCNVLDEESAAVIGGGIIQSDLIDQLAKTGKTTPFASAPSVGYVGWATLGGYGLLSGEFGLGVDQILEATIVTAEGDVVQANSEMMYALRGGGAILGIITELKIKIYPLATVSKIP